MKEPSKGEPVTPCMYMYKVVGSLVTQKSDSHMNTVFTAFSNCGSFQNPFDDTSPILSLIKKSHAPNQSKELDPFAPSHPLIMVPMQQNCKCALIMLCNMHISNVAAQFWLASKDFMKNDTVYDPLLCGKMVLHASSYSSILYLSFFSLFHLSSPYLINSIDWTLWRKRYGHENGCSFGLYELGTHTVLPLPDCSVNCPSINLDVEALAVATKDVQTAPYDEDTRNGELCYVKLQVEINMGGVYLWYGIPIQSMDVRLSYWGWWKVSGGRMCPGSLVRIRGRILRE